MSLAAPESDVAAETSSPPQRGRTTPVRRVLAIALAAVLLLASAAFGAWWGRGLSGPPSTDSAEAGFARDMQAHHQQAVELALIIRDRTDDPDIRSLAYDVATTQGQQAGQLYGWLTLWGLPQAPPEGTRMAWMMLPPLDGSAGMPDHDMTGAARMEMPGLVSRSDMDRLRSLTGVEAERLFLQLLIAHHQGGVQMAEAVLARTRNPVVTDFAQAIITAQNSEMTYMQELLSRRS